jgi:hypothetical protein
MSPATSATSETAGLRRVYQYSLAGVSPLPGICSAGAGTFGQFSTQSPKSGFTFFIEADLEAGSILQGQGLTAGLAT